MGSRNMEEHNDLCVGIDLGTTNSVLATINEKPNGDMVSKVVDIPRAVDMYNAVSGEAKLTTMKKPTLPSCIYYRQEKNYEPLVGDFAKMQYPLRPHLVARSIKSQMGQPEAEGLSPDIPDKTPPQISARILRHLLRETSKVYRCDITDAVITVPANFDPVMCKATRDAAELAGIRVRNSDGSERPVLLSEPNAVIYDLINQIRNGEISNRILDLSEKRTVLVFDLGGGTLDITMHEIKYREDNQNVLKVDEIATNRYTLLGGDDFDERIAQAMYQRYLKQYASHADVISRLNKEEPVIMPQLKVYAEHLKLDLSEKCGNDYDSGWDDPEDEIEFSTGGNMGGIGYSYDDTFTQEEIEGILSCFMATGLVYDDYKRIEEITDTRNIIYPILDVLKKASEKSGTGDVTVDAVIVNGGMSKFYMVTDRLKAFFGFEPIVALDPDQAVARGAAIYHYYLHKYDEMRDDMRLLGQEAGFLQTEEASPDARPMRIQWGSRILNDCLYLGVRNGAVHEIIPTGAELPYTSEVMTGFKVEPGQNRVGIPIRSRNLDGTYRTIANGNILFQQEYGNGAYVAFVIQMESNKVITMKAWTSSDIQGTEKIEEGSVDIAIDGRQSGQSIQAKPKKTAPTGSRLHPEEEIRNILQLYRNYEKTGGRLKKSAIANQITSRVNGICNAANKDEFAPVVLKALQEVSFETARMKLFVIARRIGNEWAVSDKRNLAALCMGQIAADLQGSVSKGEKVTTNIQAVHALSICATEKQLSRLEALHGISKYRHSCLYTHGRTCSSLQWMQAELEKDVRKVLNGQGSSIQATSYYIGVALRKDVANGATLSPKEEAVIIKRICEVIASKNLTDAALTSCILALGWICDQRGGLSVTETGALDTACEVLQNIDAYYPALTVMKQQRAKGVAMKMMSGEMLDAEDEQFLLTKLEM